MRLIIIGVIIWGVGYLTRRGTPISPVIRLPMWLAWLFGNPRGDGRVELHRGLFQVLGLIWTLTAVLVILLGVETQSQFPIVVWTVIIAGFALAIPETWVERRIVQKYHNALQASFGFLLVDGRFKIVTKKGPFVVLDSENCRIRIWLHAWEKMVVTIEPIQNGQKLTDDISPTELNLGLIIYCLTGKSPDGIALDLSTEEILTVAERAASLTRQYCTPMLQGDFSNWSELEACASELTKKFHAQERKKTVKNTLLKWIQ